jgi:hypothetical protein
MTLERARTDQRAIGARELTRTKHSRNAWLRTASGSDEAQWQRTILAVRVAAMEVFLGSDDPSTGPEGVAWYYAAGDELDGVCVALGGGAIPTDPIALCPPVEERLLVWRNAFECLMEWVLQHTQRATARVEQERRGRSEIGVYQSERQCAYKIFNRTRTCHRAGDIEVEVVDVTGRLRTVGLCWQHYRMEEPHIEERRRLWSPLPQPKLSEDSSLEAVIAALAHPKTVLRAVRMLRRFGPRAGDAASAVLPFLSSTDHDLRLSAAITLGRLGNPSARYPLFQLIDDADQRVRSAARDSLELLGISFLHLI